MRFVKNLDWKMFGLPSVFKQISQDIIFYKQSKKNILEEGNEKNCN